MMTADAGEEGSSAPVVRSQAGESCGARIDCVLGLVCINNVCQSDPETDAGDQTGAGKRGESCRSRGDCTAGLACVGGTCQKADFGIGVAPKSCVQIDCMEPKDCCPKPDTISCNQYLQYCEGGTTYYCTLYNTNCKCNADLYSCTPDTHTCKTKVMCSDSGFSGCPSGTPICNQGIECVRCLKNEDCGPDQTCTPQHTCLAGCLKDGDCPYLQTCSNGMCVDTGCTTDRECVANTRNPLSVCAMKKCKTPCQTDAECNLGQYQFAACQQGFCQDIGCQTDEECRNRLRIPIGSNARAICQAKM
jgi:hypothetical protein